MFLNAGDLIARRDGRSFILTADVFFLAGLAPAHSLSLEKFCSVPRLFLFIYLFIYLNATKRLSKTEGVNRPLHLRRIRERGGGGSTGGGLTNDPRRSIYRCLYSRCNNRSVAGFVPVYFSHQSGGGGGTSIGAELRQD